MWFNAIDRVLGAGGEFQGTSKWLESYIPVLKDAPPAVCLRVRMGFQGADSLGECEVPERRTGRAANGGCGFTQGP
ncbi:hypothetical protein IMCC26134_08875 [Verrucomicrobia bacterium IMCC26134]|nr:hypothetical protein IMCC26134_08875 [Verrucomicrobia bacterium IMCC26134]